MCFSLTFIEDDHAFTDKVSSGLLLFVKSVNFQVWMMRFNVRINVGSVFSYVNAIRTLETRRLVALVLQVSVKSPIPFIRISTIRTIEFSSNAGLLTAKR